MRKIEIGELGQGRVWKVFRCHRESLKGLKKPGGKWRLDLLMKTLTSLDLLSSSRREESWESQLSSSSENCRVRSPILPLPVRFLQTSHSAAERLIDTPETLLNHLFAKYLLSAYNMQALGNRVAALRCLKMGQEGPCSTQAPLMQIRQISHWSLFGRTEATCGPGQAP